MGLSITGDLSNARQVRVGFIGCGSHAFRHPHPAEDGLGARGRLASVLLGRIVTRWERFCFFSVAISSRLGRLSS